MTNFLLSFLLFFSFLFIPAYAEIEPRELVVGVAVTPSFKADREWKSKFERRLAYASQIFQAEFKIRFRVGYYWDWMVTDDKQDSDYLLADLMNRFPLHNADCVIGLSQLTQAPHIENMKDLDVLGRTQPFSGYVVVRYPANKLYRIQEETVLVHELGHLFGAVHTPEPTTIMSPAVFKQVPTAFDKGNRQIISLTRSMNFKNGIQALDEATAQGLLSAYLILMKYEQPYDFYYALGNVYVKLGQDEEALQALTEARKLSPNNGRIYYDLGLLYWKLGKPDEAIRSLEQAVSRFSKTSDKVFRAQCLKLLGGVYFKQKNYNAAYENWYSASVLDPEDVEVKTNLAAVYIERGQLDDAIKIFLDVMEIDAGNPQIAGNLGSAYFRKKEYLKAVQYLEMALELLKKKQTASGGMLLVSPYDLYERLGHSYLAMKQVDKAAANFQAACQIKPDVSCFKRIAQIYFESQRWEDCIRALQQSLAIEKNEANVYGVMGVAYAKKGDPQNAVRTFREGLNYAKDSITMGNFHRNIGNLYLQNQDLNLAVGEFQKAVNKDWNNPENHFGLALSYLAKNQIKEARLSLQKVLNLNPSHAQAKQIMAKLDTIPAQKTPGSF
ncbi:MAG: tetratricopeptide repeat protein [Candidatus Omnitrophica bacterium]|nr:tetratricopeptide repeat protein [Candidatus Omnitrophota bacterium]